MEEKRVWNLVMHNKVSVSWWCVSRAEPGLGGISKVSVYKSWEAVISLWSCQCAGGEAGLAMGTASEAMQSKRKESKELQENDRNV